MYIFMYIHELMDGLLARTHSSCITKCDMAHSCVFFLHAAEHDSAAC